jgi:hypothetical protein
MMNETPATVDPIIMPWDAFESGFADAPWVSFAAVGVGLTENSLSLEEVGGKHPSIE